VLFRERHGRLHPLRRRPEGLLPLEEEVFEALALLGDLHLRRNRRPIAETLSRLLDSTRAHAGIAIRPAGEQALANVLRVLDLARRFEAAARAASGLSSTGWPRTRNAATRLKRRWSRKEPKACGS